MPFTTVAIESADEMNDFDGKPFAVGVFIIGEEAEGAEIDMAFALDVTDGDGDTSEGTLNVTTIPEGSVIPGTAADEALIGGSGDDILNG